MNRDFVEMLSALCEAGADYLVVGAHAMAAHGRPRATGDLDLWVRSSRENVERVWAALERFGAPLQDLTMEDLVAAEIVIQIGVSPNRIDILTSITGVSFQEAWANRIEVRIEGITVPVLGRDELIRNKRAVGRPRDLADIEELQEAEQGEA
ncbi:MAG TPA: hypothetical protein VM737_07840 [Gemmatimonadota bacterium]|nr:hypothetical protein [Gemmatimonadota bacterium]